MREVLRAAESRGIRDPLFVTRSVRRPREAAAHAERSTTHAEMKPLPQCHHYQSLIHEEHCAGTLSYRLVPPPP